jgi:hypothetical protein
MIAMERRPPNGSATIVALMSAHRAAAGQAGGPMAFCQEAVTEIETYLHRCRSKQPGSPGRKAVGVKPDYHPEETSGIVATHDMAPC